jgi:hypothetical protein
LFSKAKRIRLNPKPVPLRLPLVAQGRPIRVHLRESAVQYLSMSDSCQLSAISELSTGHCGTFRDIKMGRISQKMCVLTPISPLFHKTAAPPTPPPGTFRDIVGHAFASGANREVEQESRRSDFGELSRAVAQGGLRQLRCQFLSMPRRPRSDNEPRERLGAALSARRRSGFL